LGNNRLSDLHSLCQFLHIAPYGYLDKRRGWLRAFGDSSSTSTSSTSATSSVVAAGLEWRLREEVRDRWLLELFAPITIRRTKEAVAQQLGLRPASVITKLLKFSNFEVCVLVRLRSTSLKWMT
jgi:SNF2 family DNA or RNA helicase